MRDVRPHAGEPFARDVLCLQQGLTQLEETRAAPTLQTDERLAELALVIAQQAPARAVGNLARNDGGGERRRGRDGVEQRYEACVQPLAVFVFERPTQGGNDTHYVEIYLF